jgi:release factor glutamine methyltransferase
VGEALRWGVTRLVSATDRPRLEVELLLAGVLDRSRIYLLAHPEAALAPDRARAYVDGVERRAAHEPLPYITGRAPFFGLDFAVTPDVLIPRPETELLVEEALAWVGAREGATGADVGTGSGCIVVSLAYHAPGVRWYATDTSAAALEVARANAAGHGVAPRVTFLHGDLLAPLPEPVDLIVSNPPYVAEGEWETLPPSVRREPPAALLSGPEGLDHLGRLLDQARTRLRPGGLVLVEVGEAQGAAALALARDLFPGAAARVLPDLAGKDRVLRLVAGV